MYIRRRVAQILALAPICFLGAMVATPAMARTNYALIVAATEYPNFPVKNWLAGPINDAMLVRDYLVGNAPVKFEPQHVDVLATGPGLTDPTHQAITDALDRLAAEAKAGDFVFLQFSGHGTVQPAFNDPSEPDGKDELFLPSDAGVATAANPAWPNGLTDNEIATKLNAIRSTGAFVWVVFNSCHSGTVTRGAPTGEEGVLDRKIDPADFGIPDSSFPAPVAEADDDTSRERVAPIPAAAFAALPSDGTDGGMVAFFAAQSTETTQEKNMPIPQADGSVKQISYGIFTYSLFSTLAKNPNMTYRQLAQSVLQDYAGKNLSKPTPMFEGKLDAPVFGTDEEVSAQQWALSIAKDGKITIPAGQLHGLGKGTKLLVLPSPASTADEALGVLEVASADTLRSVLEPAADETHAMIDVAAIPKGGFARIEAIDYNFTLRVARPAIDTDPEQAAAINAALDAIAADKERPLKLAVVAPGAPADLRLAVLSDQMVAAMTPVDSLSAASADLSDTPRLWMLQDTAEVSLDPSRRPPEMALPNADDMTEAAFGKKLSLNLVTIYRAMSLSRLGAGNSFGPKDITLNFDLQRNGSPDVETMAAETTPRVKPGDQINLDFTNNSSSKAVDINVLYIDSDYGISPLCRTRVPPKGHVYQPIGRLNETDRGSERLIAVLTEATGAGEEEDLTFLAQRGIKSSERGTGGGLSALLAELGSGTQSRGPTLLAAAAGNEPKGAVLLFPLEVLPADADYDPEAATVAGGSKPARGECIRPDPEVLEQMAEEEQG